MPCFLMTRLGCNETIHCEKEGCESIAKLMAGIAANMDYCWFSHAAACSHQLAV